jgi:dipeptidyl aminopeptidase/acylaminoacyl peptidase
MYLLLCCCLCLGDAPYDNKDATDLGVPFERFTTRDTFGRTITAYLSKPPDGAGGKKLPLILFIVFV